ncbi:MAG TPA: hemerythrin domain-containing protein [Planctomycetota bacterium]|nr:hemerythrin domain-containing protein [Planctomycetota bacterium]
MNPGQSGDPGSIDDATGKDHERLGLLLDHLGASLKTTGAAARLAFETLDRELRIHMKWEEEALFSAVRGRATAAQRHSLESLEIDHERIRDTLRGLDSTLAEGDLQTAKPLLDWLQTLLKGHNYDEEHGVYVEADRLLDLAERRRLIEALRKAPPEGTP